MFHALKPIPVIKGIGDILEIEKTPLSSRGLPVSTYEAIAKIAAAYPDVLAIKYIQNGETWKKDQAAGKTDLSLDITYSEFLGKIHQVANLFRSVGLTSDDVVSMVLPNIPEAHYVLWGAEASCIVNPINYFLDAKEIGEIIESAGSKALVVMGEHPETDIAAKLPTILEHAPGLEHVFVVGGAQSRPEGTSDFESAIAKQDAAELNFSRKFSLDQIASLFHTGGTTGLPKLAQHTHGNETFSAWAIGLHCRLEPGDIGLTGLPLFHCNAAISSGLVAFTSGATVLLAGINGYRTPGIIDNLGHLLEFYKVVTFTAVPTIYALLVQQDLDKYVLKSLRIAACGAAPMPMELFSRFERKTGLSISEGYGLTEATVCSTICPPETDPSPVGSIGVRLPYTEVKTAIINEDGKYVRDCNIDEIGTILISGPTVTPGYTEARQNKSLFVMDSDGVAWLNTGDLGRQDKDSFFWLTGRSKELIIRGGHNIDPKSIEEVLAEHPAVNLAAAVGRPDSYAGEVPVAYVDVVSDVTEAELLEYCQANIGERAAIPKAIIILDQLPVTGVGKIHKPTLALMEIETVVKSELGNFSDQIEAFKVSTKIDPKYGSIATIETRCFDTNTVQDLEAEIRKSLDSFSFKYDLKIEAIH